MTKELLQENTKNLKEELSALQESVNSLVGKDKILQKSLEDVARRLEILDNKIISNVNLMDDILSNTNTVITYYVGWGTVIIAVIAIAFALLSIFINFKNNEKRDSEIAERVAKRVEESFNGSNFTKVFNDYVEGPAFDVLVQKAVEQNQKQPLDNFNEKNKGEVKVEED